MSAAPSPSFPELTIDGLQDDVDVVDKLIKYFKCIRDKIGNDVGKSNLKPVYDEFKQTAEAIVKNDLMKCRDLEDRTGEKFKFV